MSKPVLLVHGAWTGAWAWDLVVPELEKRGVTATAIDLPSRTAAGSLAADAQAVRDAVAALGEPAVLVGHSYAGMVITDASAGNDDVAHLVYVCAALPQEGQPVGDLLASDPSPSAVGDEIQPADDGTGTVSDAGARIVFSDATDEQFASVRPKMGSHAMNTFGETASGLGWQQHPSTYVVTTQDKIFSPELQRTLAKNATQSVDIDAGHGPMLTKPSELADAIAAAAA